MNFIGHHDVAFRVTGEDDPNLLFGVMAPDIIGMMGILKLYKTRPSPNASMLRGIALHKATNDAFDAHPEIEALERSLLEGLRPPFPPGLLALQAAKAGKDIMFDGIYDTNPQVLGHLAATFDSVSEGGVNLTNLTDRPHILLMGVDILRNSLPSYSDPMVVAQRLIKRLEGTRAAIHPELDEEIGKVFAEHQPFIFAISDLVLENVVSDLKGL